MEITRDPQGAEKGSYDAIIIGGGIYGITLALEAGRRGCKTLLLEQGDFGEQTSFNSLKIIHGGLRYLQSLDLPRFRESVGERSWFLRNFPARVHTLACFMPLYGNGTRRPSVFRLALLANHFLSLNRNVGVASDHHLPKGEVVTPRKSREIFPLLDMDGLKGGAVWYDAYMPDSQLLVADLLVEACTLGCRPLNYVRATDLLTDSQGKISGVSCVDREDNSSREYRSAMVINAAGAWCRQLVSGVAGDTEALFRPSLAWNVLFKRKAISDHAIAAQARQPGSRLYFITPWKGRIFAGTGHEPWLAGPGRPFPNRVQLLNFISSLNLAVPGLELKLTDVDRIFAGLLPTTEIGSNRLTKREVIVDHGAVGGPVGLYSVGGIKFTTARLVAEKILHLAGLKETATSKRDMELQSYPEVNKETIMEQCRQLLEFDKSIIHLDDLILRRSTLWEDSDIMELALQLCELFPWDEKRRNLELDKCRACLESLPFEKNGIQDAALAE
jgi:glycerol-3-phosphate dehydrogenase